MSLNRYAAKRDTSEKPIVEALERAGFLVERMSKPADLSARKPWYPRGVCVLFECKTLRGKKPKMQAPDKRQVKQNAFIENGGAVKVGTPEGALETMFAFELLISP